MSIKGKECGISSEYPALEETLIYYISESTILQCKNTVTRKGSIRIHMYHQQNVLEVSKALTVQIYLRERQLIFDSQVIKYWRSGGLLGRAGNWPKLSLLHNLGMWLKQLSKKILPFKFLKDINILRKSIVQILYLIVIMCNNIEKKIFQD